MKRCLQNRVTTALSAAFLLCSLSSCVNSFRDTTAYFHTGKIKPMVAMLPVVDSSGAKVNWNLSAEFTEQMHRRLLNSHRLYVVKEDKENHGLARTVSESVPHAISAQVAENYAPAQFLISTELLEQKVTPYGPASTTPGQAYV